jgi:hypothetical protein
MNNLETRIIADLISEGYQPERARECAAILVREDLTYEEKERRLDAR